MVTTIQAIMKEVQQAFMDSIRFCGQGMDLIIIPGETEIVREFHGLGIYMGTREY